MTTQKKDKTNNNNERTDFISDPEHISKIINQFILNDNDTNQNKPASYSNHQYKRQHVINALTRMQLTYRTSFVSGENNTINSDEFKTALVRNIALQDNVSIPKTMNQIDTRTITFIEMIFGAFLRDNNTSDNVKNLLLLMQIPIIKLALIDTDFLKDEKHIARKILNKIAHIGIGIEDSENTIYQTTKYIIEQLLHSYDTKIDAFNISYISLDRLEKIQSSKHGKTEKETKNAIAIEYTRQLVLKELQFYTSDATIPESLQPLILSYWSTLMFHRFINHGKDSIEWREVVGILRLLIKSFSPITTREDWLALRSIYKGIVNSVISCLNNSRQNKEKSFIAASNLNNYYFSKLTSSEFNSEKSTKKNKNQSDGNALDSLNNIYINDSEPSPSDLQAKSSKDRLNAMPDYIIVGNWFEVFTDYQHPSKRLKLSVIIEQHARLVFVDYIGNKILEKNLDSFLIELRNDQSHHINDHSVFEYALSMVIISIAANN